MLVIGDRVEHPRKGKGTVIAFSTYSGNSLIEYDTWRGGHDGNGNEDRRINPNPRSCYYEDPDRSLKVIQSNPTNPMLKELLGVLR